MVDGKGVEYDAAPLAVVMRLDSSACDETRMCEQHAFGLACRSRREDQESGFAGVRGVGRIVRIGSGAESHSFDTELPGEGVNVGSIVPFANLVAGE